MRRAACAFAALLALILVAACGEKDEPGPGGSSEAERFDLALDFFVNPDHAGIYQALASGYFTDAGLDVRPRVPSDPSAPIKQVAAGQVDLAISYEPEVLLARDQGLDVVAVAALVHGPLTSLISLPEGGISEPADLEDKTVVTAGIPYQTVYLETILRGAGVSPDDVEQVDVGLNLQAPVIAGRADAMLGGFLNVEGVDLAEKGLDPRVVPVDELGIPTYDELVLVADADRLAEDPKEIEVFIDALERGTEAATEDPAAATDALVEADDALDPSLTRAQVDRTLLLLAAPKGEAFGHMDPAQWEEFAAFLADQGQIDTRPAIAEVLTNELLPGEIGK